MEVLVSVIIPCYNVEDFVEKSIKSIENQTLNGIEIIAINDGSTDKTGKILSLLAKNNPCIKYINNSTNLGLIKTLNLGIDHAKGKYIARMDADDISLPTRLEKQFQFLENNQDYGICGTGAWSIDMNDFIVGEKFLPLHNDDIKKFIHYGCPFIHPSIMVRTTILQEIKYNANYQHVEDLKLWSDILEKYKGFNLEEKLIGYRINFSSITHIYGDIQAKNANKIYLPDELFLQHIRGIKSSKARIPLYARMIKKNQTPLKSYLSVKTSVLFITSAIVYFLSKIRFSFFKLKKVSIYDL